MTVACAGVVMMSVAAAAANMAMECFLICIFASLFLVVINNQAASKSRA
jgi:hypothetical protein